MMKIFSKVSLKRKILISILSALFVVCAALMGVFALTNKTESVKAENSIGNIIISNASSNWDYYSNQGTFLPSGTYGTMFNLSFAPTAALTEHRYCDISVSPDATMSWLGANNSLSGAQGNGRFVIRLMLNSDWKGLFANVFFPNGGTGQAYNDILIASGVWPDDGWGGVFSVSFRIVLVNSKWDLYINDVSINNTYSNAFNAYVGGTTVNGGHINFAAANPQFSEGKYFYAALGNARALADSEATDLQSRSKLVSAYAAGFDTYSSATGDLATFSTFGGYIDLNVDIRNRPWDGQYSQFQITFSYSTSTSTFAYTADSSNFGTGASGKSKSFYLNFKIDPDKNLYVAPHFAKNAGESYQAVSTYCEGPINLRFAFMARSGGWGLYLIATLTNTSSGATSQNVIDFSTSFLSLIDQSAFMANVGTSAPQLNLAALGLQNTGFSNFGDIYLVTAGAYNGYEVRTTENIMELIHGSPATRVSYYDDGKAVWQAKSFIDIPANTGFDLNFIVTLSAALTAEHVFQVSFGPDSVVMNADSSQSDTGNNHFMVQISLNTDGIIRGQLFYNNGSGDACKSVNDAALGNAGAFANLAGGSMGITVGIHRVNTATAYNSSTGNGLWGIFVNGYLLDTVNFEYIINRDSTSFMAGSKNVAVTVNKSGAFGSFPADIYLTGIFAASSPSVNSGTDVSVADLKSSSGTDLITDSVSTSSNTAYLYNATTETEKADVIFKTQFTYVKSSSRGYTFMLHTVTNQEQHVPMLTIKNNILTLGSLNSNYSSPVTYLERSCPLTSNTNIEVHFGVFAYSDGTSNTLLTAKVIEVSSGTVKAAIEGSFQSLNSSSAYGMVLGCGSNSTTFNSTIHRAKFVGSKADSSAIVKQQRFTSGTATTPSITDADTYYTGYWYKNGTISDANRRSANASTGDSTTAYYVRKDMMDKTDDIPEQLNAVSSGALVAKSGLWRDSTMTSSKGYLAFMHNMSKTLYNSLESAASSGKISGFKIHVLFGNSSGTNATPTATSGNPGSINCKLMATCVDTTLNVKNIYGADSSNYSFVGYIGMSTDYKTTVFRSVLCVEILQLDGTHTYVLSDYSSSTGQQSLKGAATTALSTYSGSLTAAQKAIIANYK